jgi:hypothetical protein
MMPTCVAPHLIRFNELIVIKPGETFVRRRCRSPGQRLDPVTVPVSPHQVPHYRRAKSSFSPCRNILAACPTIGAGIQSP